MATQKAHPTVKTLKAVNSSVAKLVAVHGRLEAEHAKAKPNMGKISTLASKLEDAASNVTGAANTHFSVAV